MLFANSSISALLGSRISAPSAMSFSVPGLPGTAKDSAFQLKGVLRRVETSAGVASLDHDDGVRERRDQPIAHHQEHPTRASVGLQLREQCAASYNAICQSLVSLGIDAPQPAAQHGNRSPIARVERSAVRPRIHPMRQAAHDRDPHSAKVFASSCVQAIFASPEPGSAKRLPTIATAH
jgi:hypothetical protein